jgi:hypothetical protein
VLILLLLVAANDGFDAAVLPWLDGWGVGAGGMGCDSVKVSRRRVPKSAPSYCLISNRDMMKVYKMAA